MRKKRRGNERIKGDRKREIKRGRESGKGERARGGMRMGNGEGDS